MFSNSNMNTNKSSFLELVISLFDPFILLPTEVKTRVEQEELFLLRKLCVFYYTFLPLLYIALFFAVDKSKNPISVFILYRFGLAGGILLLGLIAYLTRNSRTLMSTSLFMTAALITIVVSWSMSLGYSVQSKWIVMMTVIVLAPVSRSFVAAFVWLVALVIISKPFWIIQHPARFLITDTVVSTLILLFAHFTKKIWIQSKVNKFLHDDAVQESIEKQMEFDTEMKRFISPVLVQRIEEKTTAGQTLVMALDDVLMRKESPVAVMFTDMRNFSTRSIDIDFVEKELVPSSSKIIDSSEDNMGIAKQIGDAVFVYYSLEDPEEGLLRATKDAVAGCIDEKRRIKELGRQIPERFFSLAYGPALVGNMASFRHREATVIGSPANLAARMDSLTKEASFSTLINDCNKVLLSKTAKELLQTFHDSFEFNEVNLEEMNLIMKSFPNEKHIYLFSLTTNNLERLNSVLEANSIKTVEAEA